MEILSGGDAPILPAARIFPIAREPLPENIGPSTRVNAVGQAAESVTAAAQDAGAELDANARGLAASQIARGAEPESVFSALVAAPEQDAGDDAVAAAPVVEPDASEVVTDVPAEDTGVSSAQAALELLAAEESAA